MIKFYRINGSLTVTRASSSSKLILGPTEKWPGRFKIRSKPSIPMPVSS